MGVQSRICKPSNIEDSAVFQVSEFFSSENRIVTFPCVNRPCSPLPNYTAGLWLIGIVTDFVNCVAYHFRCCVKDFGGFLSRHIVAKIDVYDIHISPSLTLHSPFVILCFQLFKPYLLRWFPAVWFRKIRVSWPIGFSRCAFAFPRCQSCHCYLSFEVWPPSPIRNGGRLVGYTKTEYQRSVGLRDRASLGRLSRF